MIFVFMMRCQAVGWALPTNLVAVRGVLRAYGGFCVPVERKTGVLPADSYNSVRIEIAAVAALLRNDMNGLLENVLKADYVIPAPAFAGVNLSPRKWGAGIHFSHLRDL